MRTAVLYLTVALLVAGAPARGQTSTSTLSLAPGTRVRITTAGATAPARETGRLIANGPDTLSLRPDGAAGSLSLPWTAVTDVEVSRGRHRSTLRGFAIGALIGGLSGAAIGAATYQKPKPSGGCPNSEEFCISGPLFDLGRSGDAAILGGLGAVVGGAAGALIGHAHESERWEKLALRLHPALLRAKPAHLGAAAVEPGATLSVVLQF